MLDRVLRFSITHRVFVVLATLAIAAVGAWSLRRLPIDAVPDITNRQVQVNAVAPSLSPVDVEKQVAYPIETALAGIPGLAHTRSFSRNGFAQVTAVFDDNVDIWFARQQVGERLASARENLPPGVEPEMGPITTGLGEIYMWTVKFDHPHGKGAEVSTVGPGWRADGTYVTPEGERLSTDVELIAYLRTVQDWIIRPQLRGVAGVAEVDSIGGYVKQVHVEPDLARMSGHGVTFADVLDALDRNNRSSGAGYIEHNGEAFTVRSSGRLTTIADIEDIPLLERGGVPLRLRDVAGVRIGRELRTGSATEHGEEVVLGTALMLIGANSRTVAKAVDTRIVEINRTLPPDIRATTVLDRTALVDATIGTVSRNLFEGALLVVVVLFLMLGNFRAACITAMAIPLSMLLTAIGMVETRTSGNLMSLGAIDFGLIVDGAVIIVENSLRRLAERQRELGRALTRDERLPLVLSASREVLGVASFAAAIIVVVYVPVLALTGVEGKMFRPMALTVIFALCSAFLLSLTFVPAMVALAITGRVQERESRLVAIAKSAYEPALRVALRAKAAVVAVAVLLFAACLLLTRGLGQEFAPTLAELDFVIHAYRIPGTSLTESTAIQRDIERRLESVPEVEFVFSRTGTAEMASDPMPPYLADTFVILKARDAWPDPGDTKDDVRDRLERAANEIPGSGYEFTQPIEMRFNELLAGVRGDLAVKVFGDEFDVLRPVAERIGRVLGSIPGASDVRVEQVEGAPNANVVVRRGALARYGLSVADVEDLVSIGIGGRLAGQIFEGDRRFDLVVRLPEERRSDIDLLGTLPIPIRHGEDRVSGTAVAATLETLRPHLDYLPLSAVADIEISEGPNQVSRENGKRRVVAQSNVRGRDLGSFVEEARRRIEAEVELPAGTWLEWGGQYQNLVDAKARLAVIVPVCLVAIGGLLFWSLGSARHAAIVFSGVPLAICGGIAGLWLRAMPFSISAAVGFIALSGVAVLNGVVMVTFIDQLRAAGRAVDDAIVEGAMTRLRPILMTALVASLGFVPMALATGTGAEVQRPLATVVIGGLVSSTMLTLFVLPVLYRLFAVKGPDA